MSFADIINDINIVDGSDKCFVYKDGSILNDCSGQRRYYCIFDKILDNPGSNVAPPDFVAGTGICGIPDPPPSSSLMILNSEQPDPMCIGSKATYVCDVGGVNVREVCMIFILTLNKTVRLFHSKVCCNF